MLHTTHDHEDPFFDPGCGACEEEALAATCCSCEGSIKPGERTTTYKGKVMHSDCGLDLRLTDALTELAEVRRIARNAKATADSQLVA